MESLPRATYTTQAPAAPSNRTFGLALPVIIAGLGGLACLAVGGIFLFSNLLGNNNPPATEPVAVVLPLDATATETLAAVPTAAETPTPDVSPTPEITSTPTVPPGKYVRINSITINSQNSYVVEYETFEYTEVLPGMHVHFFFDTVPPAQAGVPGNGPWILYGGPRPFTKYRVADRPAAATQMCALVANSDHSVLANSGNCMALP